MSDPTPEAEAMAAEIRGDAPPSKGEALTSVAPEASLSALEEKAAAFEAEWDQKQGAEAAPATTDQEEPKKKEDSATARSSRLQDLVSQKYGGDENAMADAYWEQARSASALSKRIDELESRLSAKGEEKNEFDSLLNEDPEAKVIAQELQTIEAETAQRAQRNSQIINEVYKVEQDIAEIRGELKRADEDDKHILQAQLRNLEFKRDSLTNEFAQNERDKRSMAKEKVGLERQRKQVEKHIRSEMESSQRAKLEEKEIVSEQKNIFEDSVAAAVKKYGIEAGSERHAYIQSTLQSQLYAFLASRDSESEGLEIPKAVDLLMKNYAKVHGMTEESFSTTSKAKLDTLTRPAPKGPTPQTKPANTGREWTPEFARARAKAILGG